jgi:D-alanyl-D-alanine carboxypeptidase
MTTFGTFFAGVVAQGGREALDDGSRTVEAQHFLLAMASGEDATTRRVLASAGLDRSRLQAALDHEFEHSLRAAGVSPAGTSAPRRRLAPDGSPQLGASARVALERTVAATSHKRDLLPVHLLLGILQATVGTVPRALEFAGIDRVALLEQVRRSLPQAVDHGDG